MKSRARTKTTAAVVYANNRNIGDQLSARGIGQLLGEGVRYLPFERRLSMVEAEIDRLPRTTLVVIGGGGLLKAPFQEFWNRIGGKLLAERRRFAVWGVGLCREWEGQQLNLPHDVLRAADVVAVRDQRSAEFLGLGDVRVVPCPSHGFIAALRHSGRDERVLVQATHGDLLDRMDLQRGGRREFTAACQGLADTLGVRWLEVDNNVLVERPLAPRFPERLVRRSLGGHRRYFSAADELVRTYAGASVVVTSRLHGAIIGCALGKPVLAFSKDPKLSDYMSSVGLADALADPHQIATSSSRLLETASIPVVDHITQGNQGIADVLLRS